MCVCACASVHVRVHVCVYRDGEREKEREREREMGRGGIIVRGKVSRSKRCLCVTFVHRLWQWKALITTVGCLFLPKFTMR